MTFDALTIVTSCVNYGKYLTDWANTIVAQSVRPGRVCIFTHGTVIDQEQGHAAMLRILDAGISCYHVHDPKRLDFGAARNRAVELSESSWVMHLDADDMLLPNAIAELHRLAPSADVVQAGYERVGTITGFSTRKRLYAGADGLDALNLSALASGNSMFRRSFWELSPYRTDLLGAWDTALWIGFARLGARFRPTTIPIFQYRQHADSIFNQRRSTMGWTRVHTSAMLKKLRRNYHGVAVIVPRDCGRARSPERDRNFAFVLDHYARYHPEWPIIEGICPSTTWIKGSAINQALGSCTAETLIIADADVIVDPDALNAAVAAVQSGTAWAMPHRQVRRASAAATAELCGTRTEAIRLDPSDLDRPAYEGAPGGGIVAVPHAMYDAIGGIPYVFREWGSEDRALALLCDTLLGPCLRGSADLIHLWHPAQPQTRTSQQNVRLLQNLGHIARRGPDSLVRAVHAMPRPVVQSVRKAKSVVTPINHAMVRGRIDQRRSAP
jgi:glycosyltransferase involved in cell wall biosynthesis